MKRNFLVISILELSILFQVPVLCALGTGSTGATFLKVGVGARPSGMGEVFTALCDDVNAIYWNPAGLCQLEMKNEISVMRNKWFEDIEHTFIGYAHNFNGNAIGIGLTNLNISGIIEISETGGSIGTFNATNTSYDFAYGHAIKKNLDFGMNLKYITQKIGDVAGAKSFGTGFGLLYGFSDFNLGIVFQNIGSIKFTTKEFVGEEDPLPMVIKSGLVYKNDRYNLGMEVEKSIDSTAKFKIGGELNFKILVLRTGYRFGYDLGNLSLGAGLKIGPINLDYANVSYSNLGDTHRVSLTAKFGKIVWPEKVVTEKINIAVTEFVGKNVSAMDSSIVSDFLRTELVRTKFFRVVEKANMDKILAEAAFQQTGCTEAECAVQIGKILNVQQIVVGTVSKLMGTYYISINLVDVETGEIIQSERAESNTSKGLPPAAEELARRLVSQ